MKRPAPGLCRFSVRLLIPLANSPGRFDAWRCRSGAALRRTRDVVRVSHWPCR